MTELIVELDPPGDSPVAFAGDTAPLVYFLSFAFAARYGSQHELTKAALLLRGGEHKLDLKPLLTFADRAAEEPLDKRELERAWQDAAPLGEIARYATGFGPGKAILETRPELVLWAHGAGLQVSPWTFRESSKGRFGDVRSEMEYYVRELGVDRVITDHPDRFPR